MSTISIIHYDAIIEASSSKETAHDATVPRSNVVLDAAAATASQLRASTPTDANSESLPEQASRVGNEDSKPKLRIAVIMSSLCACVFVAAIDVTIISPALPAIANHFKSASGYQWVGSSYVLGSTASTPSWGNLSNIWGRKAIMLLALVFFFAGSLVCALGETMIVFLVGRAIQGVGASGLLTLVNITISDLFSMRDRGFYFGLTSVVWALASGFGPGQSFPSPFNL